MEVYIISGFGLLCLTIILLGPVVGIIPSRKKTENSHGRSNYFFFTMPAFFFALSLSDNIKQRSATSGFFAHPAPYIGLVAWGMFIICGAYLTLRNVTPMRRWSIFSAMALGVAVSFALLLGNQRLFPWSLAGFFAPQLLLFFTGKPSIHAPAGHETNQSKRAAEI